jgi:alpha-ketoglutarate-dependent taurine dioxygenase
MKGNDMPAVTNAQLKTEPLTPEFGVKVVNTGDGSVFDLPRDGLIKACKASGVVYFEGFNLSLPDFEQFTNTLCHDWLPYQGGAHERVILNPDSDGTIYSVAFYLGQKEQLKFELPLHCDMSYIKHSPVALFFYSVHPAADRGETTICDGAAVYDQLQPSTREALHKQRIKYIRFYPEGNWQGRFGTDDLDEVRDFCDLNELELTIDSDTGTLKTVYTVSAVPESRWGGRPVFRNSILPVVWQEEIGKTNSLVRFEDGSPLPPEVIQDIKSVTSRLVYLAGMKKGDFMFVDNTRILHGRKQFDDPKREVAIRMVRDLDW